MKPNLTQLAKRAGVSERTLKRYKAAGVDIASPGALRKHAGGKKHSPKSLEAPDLRAARLKKTLLECERIAFALECDRKLFVAVADAAHREEVASRANELTEALRLAEEGAKAAALESPEVVAARRALEKLQPAAA